MTVVFVTICQSENSILEKLNENCPTWQHEYTERAYLNFEMRSFVVKFIKFGVVGTVGTVIDFAITWLLFSVLSANEYLANTVGFIIAATANYIFNRVWTWRSRNKNVQTEYAKFIGVSLLGLVLNTLVIFAWLEMDGVAFEMFGYYIDEFWVAKVVATIAVMVWNFLANHFYTFKESR